MVGEFIEAVDSFIRCEKYYRNVLGAAPKNVFGKADPATNEWRDELQLAADATIKAEQLFTDLGNTLAPTLKNKGAAAAILKVVNSIALGDDRLASVVEAWRESKPILQLLPRAKQPPNKTPRKPGPNRKHPEFTDLVAEQWDSGLYADWEAMLNRSEAVKLAAAKFPHPAKAVKSAMVRIRQHRKAR